MAWKTRLVLGVALVLIGAIMLAGCQRQATPEAAAPSGEPQQQGATSQAAPGEPEAPVVVVAYYPLNDDHKFIADYLEEFGAAHPGDVSVTVYDMQSPEGRQAWSKTGLTCAAVFINGKTKYDVEKDGKTEEVEFIKRMDVFWTRADFEAVVNKLLEEAKKPAE